MKNTWISSDHHFDHGKILEYQVLTRPYFCMSEMEETLIDNHNSVVSPEDDVYFLGDFAFMRDIDRICSILDRMNGNKHFIFGNHDKIMHTPEIKYRFVWMKDYHELKIDGPKKPRMAVLSHYPHYSWNKMHYGSLHFYGHTHGAVPKLFTGRGKDIGIDTNKGFPYNLKDLSDKMFKLKIFDSRSG